MLVYKVGEVIVAAGHKQHGRHTLHGHTIPRDHLCVLLTSVTTCKEHQKAPLVLEDPEENGDLRAGGYYAIPLKFLHWATIDQDGLVHLNPYNR